MLRRVGLLVAATALLVALSFVWFGLRPMVDQLARAQFDVAGARVESELAAVFTPPTRLLLMSRGWLGGQAPDLASPEAFNQVFKPVLAASPHITSVVAGTSSGQGWLLLQQPGGGWLNRMTDMARWGAKQHLLIDQLADGSTRSHFGTQTYDPRQRPWFQGALSGKEDTDVFWTAPYTFFTTGDPGVTVSTRTRLKDGRDFVLGFDLMLRDLSKTTLNAKVGQHGLAMVMTEDERVLGLPAAPAALTVQTWLTQVLKPAAGLGLPAVTDALQRWHSAQRPSTKVLSFESGNKRWLVSARPYALGEQRLWVLVMAPAGDFAPAWWSIALALGLALALVLGLALWVTQLGVRRLSQPLEALALASQRIGRLNFEPGPPVQSKVAEIAQLADSQASMLAMLNSNHAELAARAQTLSHQIATLQATERLLQQKNQTLHTIFDKFPGGISVFDADLRLSAYNPQFKTLFDLPDALFARESVYFEDFERFNALRGDYGTDDPETYVASCVARARTGRAHTLERVLPNGSTLEIRGTPLPDGGFVTLYLDITATKQHEHELENLAHFDTLTGLPNRVLLAERLRLGMAQVAQRALPLAVVYLDLDGFKTVNDAHGHTVGDQLLVAIAKRMQLCLRDGDTLARVGGDEFVAVLLDVSGLEDGAPLFKRLLLAADEPVHLDARELRVSASAGVAFYPQSQNVDAEQLLRQADQAMYQAKQAGKNRFDIFDAELDLTLRHQFEGLQCMRQALTNQEFVLFYQPKVNMRSGLVVGAEALIRWQHPERGLLAPGLFLPLLEDDPLAIEVGEWVIDTALRQIAQWQAQGLDMVVSVNVGAMQLQQSNFVDRLRAALARHAQVAPRCLAIEVLETSALQDIDSITRVMQDCRQMGVTFALDDFGTGYSSLTYLKRLPVTQLKIDQSFVRDMLDDPDDLSILQGVLGMAQAFHREVIAEGVETVAHGARLLQLGCELAQGYGIARPMPADQFPGWVGSWRIDPSWALQ
jgi:diguanylate cyclase (GGDEF)-like protein